MEVSIYLANTFDSSHLYRLVGKTAWTAGWVSKLQDITYSYDAMGNMTSLAEAGTSTAARNATYAYDDLDRLVAATGTAPGGALLYAERYSYDPIGNLLQKKATQSTSTIISTYAYTGNTAGLTANPHAVTSISNQQGTTTLSTLSFTYDQKGNPTTSNLRDGAGTVIPGSEHAYTWDDEDQLSRLVIGAATSSHELNYVYGVGGDRLQQREASSTSLLYVSKNYNLTMSATGTITDIEKHVYADSLHLATIQGSGPSVKGYWNHVDHLSGANIITDAAGAVQETLDYLPFGGIRLDQKAGTWSEQRKYAGHEFDDNSGLSYMEARYYDPATGRFLNEDPAFRTLSFNLEDPQSLNSYSYARNNPLKYVDLDGRFPISLQAAHSMTFAVGDFLTLGLYTQAFDRVGIAGSGLGTRSARGEATAGDYVGTIGRVALSTAQVASGALVAGATLGELSATISPGKIQTTSKYLDEDFSKEVNVSRSKYGEAAEHILDAQRNGKPSVLTIDRPLGDANRTTALKGMSKVPGKQLDEYPPAMFKEGGANASVRAISPRDNMSAGACIGNQCRSLSNGSKVKITVTK
ncbi:MAG: RHS repeat-associated core domain-containing protein [Patescibacteria group bacterium]